MELRILKFRVWIYKDQKFYTNVLVGNGEKISGMYYDDVSLSWNVYSKLDGAVQQFTGYVDINNVEIYEGDIIQYRAKIVDKKHCLIGDNDIITSDVVWQYGQYYMNDGNYSNTLQHLRHVEVVGNIFKIE